jgi:hypothetical protein
MLGQANSQTRFFGAAWDDQRPRRLTAGVSERSDREREKDRREARRGRGFLIRHLQLGLQSFAFFGEVSVLRFQIGDLPRLCLRAQPLRLAFAHRIRELRAQTRSLDYKPRTAEADKHSGGYAKSQARATRQPGEMGQPGESSVSAIIPFSPQRLRAGVPCGHILIHYSSQSPGEHHVSTPPWICQITPFEAFTIGLGERTTRRSVEQIIFDFAEPIVFGLVDEILVLERGLFRRGEFSQQIAFDQIILAVSALHNDHRLSHLHNGRIRVFISLPSIFF